MVIEAQLKHESIFCEQLNVFQAINARSTDKAALLTDFVEGLINKTPLLVDLVIYDRLPTARAFSNDFSKHHLCP